MCKPNFKQFKMTSINDEAVRNYKRKLALKIKLALE